MTFFCTASIICSDTSSIISCYYYSLPSMPGFNIGMVIIIGCIEYAPESYVSYIHYIGIGRQINPQPFESQKVANFLGSASRDHGRRKNQSPHRNELAAPHIASNHVYCAVTAICTPFGTGRALHLYRRFNRNGSRLPVARYAQMASHSVFPPRMMRMDRMSTTMK